ncbi:hypothetical protein OS493_004944 [Desmophyllum pertusum]|uniref:G-protein coupled receptors family 1 profile domain-containing protein n=1 Tax=Desmophyllum pertusum TaxID=174260 RepID=A0A9X0CT64_9CNID|nr:hypothetical protein OS493_004944 [Desmophyllum pertusum]
MNKTDLACSFLDVNLEETKETLTANILTCFLNAVFSLITCAGNAVILYAIRKTPELHSPSFILLFCLAASDLLVGLICQPFFVAYKRAEIGNDFSVYCPLRMTQSISSWITSGVSLLTLSAVSIDRLLALTLHLRYNVVVTVPRVFQTVFGLWIFSITVVMLRFWIRNWIIFPVVITLLTFLVTSLSTLKIFQVVRRHHRQISQQQQSVDNHLRSNSVNVLKCRKSAVTVLYVYGLFLIFYLPFCVVMLVDTLTGYTITVKIAYDYAATVVFINSFLNPLVYCWRIREIRRAVKNTLWKDYRLRTEVISWAQSGSQSRQ